MLCQTIAHTLLELVQALRERAMQAFDIIGAVDISGCIRECPLQPPFHVIKAAPLKWMLLQIVATPSLRSLVWEYIWHVSWLG